MAALGGDAQRLISTVAGVHGCERAKVWPNDATEAGRQGRDIVAARRFVRYDVDQFRQNVGDS